VYATGDRARWLEDGNLEFLGRADEQVKIRGYRIELGEIENVLNTIAGVRQAVVLVEEDSYHNKQLVGFIVGDEYADGEKVRQALAHLLPDYMMPYKLLSVASIPLTVNGKTDRRKLLETAAQASTEQAYAAPRNETEKVLVSIWQDLLEQEKIGIHDDFFALGGHSLLAIRVLSAIRNQLNKELTIRVLFEFPTIAKLCLQMDAGEAKDLLPAIHQHNKDTSIPLSFSQERLWFIDRLQGSVQYHMPWVFRMKGALDVKLLEDSFKAIVQRHEVLRTVIKENDGIGYQQAGTADHWIMEYITEGVVLQNHASVRDYIDTKIKTPYNLSEDYMLRVTVIALSAQEHIVIAMVHHIAFDGWSISIMAKELTELYSAGIERRKPVLRKPGLQYADYANWQRQYLGGGILERKLAYWKEKLQDVEPLALITDRPRPPVQNVRGAAAGILIAKNIQDQLIALSQREGVTLFMTLLSAFKAVLYRHTGQSDLCIGASMAVRPQKEVEDLIGFFINTHALRDHVSGTDSFRSLLQQVKQTMLEAYEHQDVPFEKIVEALGVERDMSRNPVYQVVMILQNAPESGDLSLGNISISNEDLSETLTRFELTISMLQSEQGLQVQLLYRTELYDDATINWLLLHFKNILEVVVDNTDALIGSCSLLDEIETQRILAFGKRSVDWPAEKNVLDIFKEQVAITPGNTALVFRDQRLTYRELDEQSNQVAHYLKSRSVRIGDLVPVCMERSHDMIVAMIGVMKAGAAYVPVDTDYPDDRIRYMLEDLRPSVIIAGSGKGQRVINIAANHEQFEETCIIDMEADMPVIECCPKTIPGIKQDPSNLAYVIYTSGSTGKPKGVMIEHRSLVDYYYGLQNSIAIRECKSHALVSTLSADLGNTVIYGALLSGAALHVCSHTVVNDAGLMLDYCRDHFVDCIKIVPSHWKALCLDDELLLPSKLLIFGGELLQGAIIGKIYAAGANCKVINHYGPTETTVGKLMHEVDLSAEYSNGVPIGHPFSNTSVYILNKEQALCPQGIAGEICIAGEGLARGYWGQPEMTDAKFIADPFNAGGKMYKTGDIGRWLPSGDIEYIGRIDDQVKIRGYRIELGEIERTLMTAPGVKQAIVIARTDDNGDKRLAAYLVTDNVFEKELIVAYLREKLPDYMVPAMIMQLDAIPLTANGKVDRKKLPEKNTEVTSSVSYAGPRTAMEKIMVEMWQEMLNVERVGIHDNFFELGGDSIITIQIVSRARKQGYELQVSDLFEHQTIAGLSRGMIDRDRAVETKAEQGVLEGEAALLPIQRWYFESQPTRISHYNQSVLLGIDKSITESQLQAAMEQLVRHHDALRFIYTKTEDGWQQEYGKQVGRLELLDLNEVSEEDFNTEIERHNNLYQQSLVIETGRLVCMAFIKTALSQSHNRLLIVIHHLAVDGVSWRILLEDLEALLTGVKFNAPVSLGTKTSSYREWHDALERYAKSTQVQGQKQYWKEVVSSYEPLPVDKRSNENVSFRNTGNYTVSLDAAHTRSLLQEISKKYHTEINDVLLSALARTVCTYSSKEKTVIGLEGHGREQMEGIDTSRTVGWFTNKYPVLLTCASEMSDSALLKNTKELLRRIPGKGMAYPVLKYMEREEALQGIAHWDIVFNYLGQFDNIVGATKLLTGAAESTGLSIADENGTGFKIAINCMVQGGVLILNWSFSRLHFNEDTIKALAEKYIMNLATLVDHCLTLEDQVFTPSDYGLGTDISYKELDDFLDEKESNAEGDDIMVF
jgi:amino acid adenylation domain-containing protein/non-ribosomal peptide synthase protein (TIGR01720 family)